ncbi:sporulation transcription factor Spo0A [Neobacillus sp. Marseille-QA0830]
MIKIAIVDDNYQFTEIMNDYFMTQDDMKVVGIAYNGLEGMELIRSEEPDLIILDLVMPYSDGLSILGNLHVEKRDTKVLMLTSMGTENIIQKANEYGAAYFLMKPVDLSVLSDNIRSICSQEGYVANRRFHDHPVIEENKVSNDMIDHKLEMRITDVLRSIGIPANLKGYFFLREAIEMVLSDSGLLGGAGGITKVIYPTIADRHYTTPSRVERAIRHAIEVCWNRGDVEMLKSVFGPAVGQLKDKPANGKFIMLMSDYFGLKGAR